MKFKRNTILSILLVLCVLVLSIGCFKSAKKTTSNTKSNSQSKTTKQSTINNNNSSSNTQSEAEVKNSTEPDNATSASNASTTVESTATAQTASAVSNVNTSLGTASSVGTNVSGNTSSSSSANNSNTVLSPTPSAPASDTTTNNSTDNSGNTAPTPTPSTPTAQTLSGYIEDQDCFNPDNPGDDSKTCLLMKSCAASGYGIAVLQSDGKYKYYFFDGNFAPTATGTQVKASDLIENNTKNSHIYITVTGTLKGDTKTVDGVAYPVITVSSLAEASEPAQSTPTAASKTYDGWISDSNNFKNVSDPTKITKASLKNGDYGIIIVQDDDSLKFFKFDADGQKFAKENYLDVTSKAKDLRVKVNGVIDGDTISISKIEDEQELIGIVVSKNNFDANTSNPTVVKRDDIVAKASADSGYGIALKQSDGTYKFYKFDDNGNKSAASLLSWYVRWSTNISSIPVLVDGVINGDSIVASRVLRERPIPGQLASKYIADQDKALKDITRADLLTPESIASGYGYYVHSCGGHEFFPFDEDSSKLIENFIQNSKTQGEIKVNLNGFWYWIGSTVKVTSVSEDTVAENTPDTPINEEITGLVSTRNYFKSSEYKNNGGPGTITKDFLLDPYNAASGYGIIYNTCCNYGYLRFDENGTKLIKDIIANSKNSSNIRVVVQGHRDQDTIYVDKVTEAYSQTFSGALINNGSDGYGVKVKQQDGTFKFYKLEAKGSYYHSSSQAQAADFLKNFKKDTTTVDVKGYFDGDSILVSNITENLSINVSPSVQTITGFVEDVHCFFAYADSATDSKGCLSMKSCAASGYGITVPQSDGTKKFYFFDGTYANNGSTFNVGTGGQLLAWNLIQNTTKKNDVTVKVTGTFDGTEETYVDKSGVSHSFSVLKVSSLSEASTLDSIAVTTPANKLTYTVGDKLDITGLQVTGTYGDKTTALQAITAANVTGFDSSKPATEQVLTVTVGGKTTTYTVNVIQTVIFTGYIEDEDCFIGYVPNYGDDSKGCLSMKSCAASGYGITALQSDGTYKFYYFDGDFATLAGKTFNNGTGSQLDAWNLIHNTAKSDHVSIKVTGTLNGDTKVSPYDGKSYPVIKVTSLTEN